MHISCAYTDQIQPCWENSLMLTAEWLVLCDTFIAIIKAIANRNPVLDEIWRMLLLSNCSRSCRFHWYWCNQRQKISPETYWYLLCKIWQPQQDTLRRSMFMEPTACTRKHHLRAGQKALMYKMLSTSSGKLGTVCLQRKHSLSRHLCTGAHRGNFHLPRVPNYRCTFVLHSVLSGTQSQRFTTAGGERAHMLKHFGGCWLKCCTNFVLWMPALTQGAAAYACWAKFHLISKQKQREGKPQSS